VPVDLRKKYFLQFLKGSIERNHRLSVNELRLEVNERFGLNVSTAAVRRALAEMGYSRGKVKFYQATSKLCLMFGQVDRRAIEQNEDARAEQLVFVDESSCDRRAASKGPYPTSYGWNYNPTPTYSVCPRRRSVLPIRGASNSTSSTNPFYGPSPLEFQTGYGIRPSVIPQVVNHYHPLPSMTQIPYMLIPGPSYQYLWPYENIQPPVLYPPSNWQSTIFPHPTLPPPFAPTGVFQVPRSVTEAPARWMDLKIPQITRS